MKLNKTNAIYFSPTHGTQKYTLAVAEGIGLPVVEYDFSKLEAAPAAPEFSCDELVLIGLPVYVGRLPRVTLDYLTTLKGNGTPCALLVTFGNRHYDDALVELEDLVKAQGFVPIAGSIWSSEHSFSDRLAGGRPNEQDKEAARAFGAKISEKLSSMDEVYPLAEGAIPGGRPYRLPYRSQDPKVKPTCPVVNENCIDCGLCAAACPTGAIDPENPRDITPEKCIKCRACAHVCPTAAIDMVDASFWSHTDHLIAEYGPIDWKPILVL